MTSCISNSIEFHVLGLRAICAITNMLKNNEPLRPNFLENLQVNVGNYSNYSLVSHQEMMAFEEENGYITE